MIPLALSITHHGNRTDKYFFGIFQDGNSETLWTFANTGLTLKDCLLVKENTWIYSRPQYRLLCLVSPFLIKKDPFPERRDQGQDTWLSKDCHRRAHLHKQTSLSAYTYSPVILHSLLPSSIAQKSSSVLWFSSKIKLPCLPLFDPLLKVCGFSAQVHNTSMFFFANQL